MADYDSWLFGLAEDYMNGVYGKYDEVVERIVDNKFEAVYTYSNGDVIREEETKETLMSFYDIELEDNVEVYKLVKFEVYNVWEEIGINYGKHEDDYEEEVIERSIGDLLYSEEF